MQTVNKAMKLLNLFTVQQPEIGLSELARMADFDKAATRRFLVALQKHQFIEQNPDTRQYRLGIGFLHLAKIREATIPLEAIVHPALARLCELTRETAHASLWVNQVLSTIGISFPARGNRAHLELGEALPLHATASGIAFLAFSGEEWLDKLPDPLPVHASGTVTDIKQLKTHIVDTQQRGIAIGSGVYCNEVTGIAVPYFAADGLPMGTLAIATPNSRLDDALKAKIQSGLLKESRHITQAVGGQFPDNYQQFLNQQKQQAA